MNRFLNVVLLSAVLAAWVGAQATGTRPSPADQARMVSQNRSLYRAVVERGLTLADQPDALARAGICTEMAKDWVKEIESAARSRDAARVSELGKQLSQVVDLGVVPNLEQARKDIKSGSQYEKALFRHRDDAAKVLTDLANLLRGVDEFEPIWKAVADGAKKVENAAKDEKR